MESIIRTTLALSVFASGSQVVAVQVPPEDLPRGTTWNCPPSSSLDGRWPRQRRRLVTTESELPIQQSPCEQRRGLPARNAAAVRSGALPPTLGSTLLSRLAGVGDGQAKVGVQLARQPDRFADSTDSTRGCQPGEPPASGWSDLGVGNGPLLT